jgi:hypothetical protein
MIFRVGVTVSGKLCSSFVFASQRSYLKWVIGPFRKLQKEYGDLNKSEYPLPGLRIGDKCRVHGEGPDIFTIEGIVKYNSPNRYGFLLDSGVVEDVHKCY